MTDKEALQVAVLSERVRQLNENMAEMRADVSAMKQATDKYKGGVLVIAAIGSLIGMGLQLWNSVQWHPHN